MKCSDEKEVKQLIEELGKQDTQYIAFYNKNMEVVSFGRCSDRFDTIKRIIIGALKLFT